MNIISQFTLGIIDAALVPRDDNLAKEAFSYGIYYCILDDKMLLYKYDYQLKMLLLAREQKNKEIEKYITMSILGYSKEYINDALAD